MGQVPLIFRPRAMAWNVRSLRGWLLSFEPLIMVGKRGKARIKEWVSGVLFRPEKL